MYIAPPDGVVADYNSTDDTINVMWMHSISQNKCSEYRVFYYGDDGSSGSIDVPIGENEGVIGGVSQCVDYKIGVMALSVYNHSEIKYATNITKAGLFILTLWGP